MEGWALFWKFVFIFGVTAFAAMSIWVALAGLLDIKRMFTDLKKSPNRKSEKETE